MHRRLEMHVRWFQAERKGDRVYKPTASGTFVQVWACRMRQLKLAYVPKIFPVVLPITLRPAAIYNLMGCIYFTIITKNRDCHSVLIKKILKREPLNTR